MTVLLIALLLNSAKMSTARSETAAELSKKLSNPIASLISVPVQYDFDGHIGLDDNGRRHRVNIQPVVPFSLNQDWNVISRTIVPVISQSAIGPGSGNQFGLGDTLQAFFFSPKQSANGITWGAGPVFLLPTGTDRLLTADKWGAGPTAVALLQKNGWTIGALSNHIWSFAGGSNRPDVNATLVQPFVSYTTSDSWTFGLSSEATYNWNASDWSVPIVFDISKLTVINGQAVSIGGGVRYWANNSDGGAEGWGFRGKVTFLFPTGE